jgi:hypothetical protein
MPRGRPTGSTNDGKVLCIFRDSEAIMVLMLPGAGRKSKRFEKIDQEAQKRFEEARLNHVPLDVLEAECYAEIAISSKGTNAVHRSRAILKLIEEARGGISNQNSQLSPAAPNTTIEEFGNLEKLADFGELGELGEIEKLADFEELAPAQPLTKSEQIYADRFKYGLENEESNEEAHIRSASKAQTYEMLVDYYRVQAERELLDEKKNEKIETKEVDPDDEDSSRVSLVDAENSLH